MRDWRRFAYSQSQSPTDSCKKIFMLHVCLLCLGFQHLSTHLWRNDDGSVLLIHKIDVLGGHFPAFFRCTCAPAETLIHLQTSNLHFDFRRLRISLWFNHLNRPLNRLHIPSYHVIHERPNDQSAQCLGAFRRPAVPWRWRTSGNVAAKSSMRLRRHIHLCHDHGEKVSFNDILIISVYQYMTYFSLMLSLCVCQEIYAGAPNPVSGVLQTWQSSWLRCLAASMAFVANKVPAWALLLASNTCWRGCK